MGKKWQDYLDSRTKIYAFFGNSLLELMTEDSAFGLEPSFWQMLWKSVTPLDESLDNSLWEMIECVKPLSSLDREAAVRALATDYTKLFIGPGKPAAPPWETIYKHDTEYAFGEQTFEMKKLLRKNGLEVHGKINQLEDHLGLELLFLSMMSEKMRISENDETIIGDQIRFVEEHPLSWIAALIEKAKDAEKTKYYSSLLKLVVSYLSYDKAQLERRLQMTEIRDR